MARMIIGCMVVCYASVVSAQTATVFQFPIDNYEQLTFTLKLGDPNSEYLDQLNRPQLHLGEDVLSPVHGTNVKSIGAGKVMIARKWKSCPNWGYILVIEHTLPDGSKVCSIYGHLDPTTVLVTEGQVIVSSGELLGKTGSYECWKEHLHFGIHQGAYGAQIGRYASWLAGYSISTAFPNGYISPSNFIRAHLSPSCTPILSGMVGLWLGEGNANDTIAAHNGTIFNGVTFAPGEVGQSFSFDGTNGNVRIPHSASFNSPNALSLEAWIFPTQFAVPSATFLGKWDSVDGVNQRSYALNINELGELVFYLNTDGSHENFQALRSTTTVPLNNWSHVAGVYDGSTMKTYINGQLQGQMAYSRGIFAGSADVSIGAIASGGPPGQSAGNFTGRVDEAAIYNRALAASEVLGIFNAGSAGKCR